MIRMIRGTAIARGSDHIVIDVGGAGGGFGVKVFAPEPTVVEIPLNSIVALHTHLHVRDNALNLFGFMTEDELTIFELLLGVNGVGPKVAMATLSTLTPDAIRLALANDEPAVISRAPGIGKRTAQKIVLELRDKVQPPSDFQNLTVSADIDTEVIEALTTLGYSVVEAQRAIQQIPSDIDSVEDRLRIALSQFDSP